MGEEETPWDTAPIRHPRDPNVGHRGRQERARSPPPPSGPQPAAQGRPLIRAITGTAQRDDSCGEMAPCPLQHRPRCHGKTDVSISPQEFGDREGAVGRGLFPRSCTPGAEDRHLSHIFPPKLIFFPSFIAHHCHSREGKGLIPAQGLVPHSGRCGANEGMIGWAVRLPHATSIISSLPTWVIGNLVTDRLINSLISARSLPAQPQA